MSDDTILVQASGVVAKALYDAGASMDAADRERWINRPSREERIKKYRAHHGISDAISDGLVMLAISESWDLE
jgi:hypothetical protein